MRVRAGLLTIVEPSQQPSKWNHDLMALRRGDLSFEVFARRHTGIVRRMAAIWSWKCPERFGLDDAIQEALLEIWRAVDSWDPARGVPIAAFVRVSVRFRLQSMSARVLKGREVETTYLWATGRRDDAVPDRMPLLDERVSASRRLASVIGALDPSAGEVVMGIVAGDPLETIRQDVYARRTPGGALKKVRSVIREAARIANEV